MLCSQSLIQCDFLTYGNTTLAKFLPVRMSSSGYFFLLTGFYKPLMGFKVEKEGASIVEQPDVETLCMVRNLRYFGGNPGYFTQSDKGVIVQLWHPKLGLTYTCVDASEVSSAFELSLENEDVSGCLGENYQVRRLACLCGVPRLHPKPPSRACRLSARRPSPPGWRRTQVCMTMRRVVENTSLAKRELSQTSRPYSTAGACRSI